MKYPQLSHKLKTILEERNRGQVRFIIDSGQSFPIPRRLIGKEGFIHELEFDLIDVGHNGAECYLKVYRIMGLIRTEVDTQWISLELEDRPYFEYHDLVDCALKLERIEKRRATLNFTQTSTLDR